MTIKNLLGVGFLIASLFACSVSAQQIPDDAWVFGKVYVKDTGAPVAGADVRVVCDETGAYVDLITDSSGVYDTCVYDAGVCMQILLQCPINTNVTVTASKDGLSNTEHGTLDDSGIEYLGIALVDVPIFAPEVLSAIVAVALSAPAFGYLLVKKKKK